MLKVVVVRMTGGLAYTLLVLGYMELAASWQQLKLPVRPWYTTKATVSFADVLRLAQTTLAHARWHSLRRLRANLRAAFHTTPSQRSAAQAAALTPSHPKSESRV
jgi:hypothetical protein